ncbi:histidine phosphatase family protein [Sphingomonas sp. Y38-1Y]|uniref:SixA phosphatase family protein n=1 Tax=Sphingomonas sp. Y38-1Y TaxID=3078265 RepID=UPI0028F13F7E|nr:histidine phosphatase family protein [Sphingomonas sp. Y38-1Y]
MPSLTLLRHAKSSWDDAVARDFDRPLNTRGRRAAVVVGTWMRREGLAFDHIAASPAVRVIETLDGVSEGYGTPIEPEWDKRIYLASAATLLDLVREFPADADAALMVGHNPGLEELVLTLVPDAEGLRSEVEVKYPTAAVAVLSWPGGWADAGAGRATLDRFVRPRDLAEGLGPDD